MATPTRKDVDIPSKNRALKGTIFGAEEPGDRGLLFVHGLGSSQLGFLHRAETASAQLGMRCLTFDLSGHGLDSPSVAQYSVYDHLEDALAAYDYLVTAAAPHAQRIGACGASYGAYLAALLSEYRSVRRLLLRAPALAGVHVEFPDPDQVPVPAEFSGRSQAFDSLNVLSRFTGEVLILESEKDEVVRHPHITAHLAAFPRAEHEVIAGATHKLSEPAWDEVFIETIIRWFRDL
jgi:pimeloyl-ACP methyl ester carboxylesterase